jgi:hypothetical protein
MIKITAKKDGFRRCGMAHPSVPTEHPDETFSQDQLAELQAEPMLVVEVAISPDPEKPKPKSKSGSKLESKPESESTPDSEPKTDSGPKE